jgi:hypothetical protein
MSLCTRVQLHVLYSRGKNERLENKSQTQQHNHTQHTQTHTEPTLTARPRAGSNWHTVCVCVYVCMYVCACVCVCVCGCRPKNATLKQSRVVQSSWQVSKLLGHAQKANYAHTSRKNFLSTVARTRAHTLKRSLVLSPCCAVNASSQPRSGVVNRLTTVSNPQFPMAPVLWPAHFLFTTRLSVRPFFVSPVRSARPSGRPSVRPSFHRSVRPSVLRFPVPLCSSVARPFFPGPSFVRLGSPSRSHPSTRGRRW